MCYFLIQAIYVILKKKKLRSLSPKVVTLKYFMSRVIDEQTSQKRQRGNYWGVSKQRGEGSERSVRGASTHSVIPSTVCQGTLLAMFASIAGTIEIFKYRSGLLF